MLRKLLVLLFICGISLFADDSPYKLVYKLEPANGLLKSKETVKVTASLLKNGKPAIGETLRIISQWEKNVVEKKDIVFDGTPIVTSYSSDKPGWIYFTYQVLDANKKPIVKPGKQIRQGIKKDLLFEVGAMFDMEKILPKDNYPADFKEFWEAEKAKLKAVPIKAEITPLQVPQERFEGKILFYTITISCLGRAPVTGYLACPVNAKEKSLPIVVDYQSSVQADCSKNTACVAALNLNAIAMNMSWHGLETGHPAEWYVQQCKFNKEGGRFKIDDPLKWTYHDMFFRVLRTLEYMKTRPEWNGKDLIVRGGSLGGYETIAAAALDHDVTLAIIDVPAGCEYNALDSGRWPSWLFRYPSTFERLKQPVVQKSMAYHDGINFARLIQCETYVCTGFADEICFPSNVLAFYNALPLQENVKKFLCTSPYTGHYGTTKNDKGTKRLAAGINSLVKKAK